MQVEFNYSTNIQDYTIVANVFPGIKSVRNTFSRFQEADDDDEVEIVSITDDAGNQCTDGAFTGKQIREIKDLAIEHAGEESEEIEY